MAAAARSLVFLLLLAMSWTIPARGRTPKEKAKREKAKEADLTPTSNDFDGVECKKCMTQVMRLLVPATRGCMAGNASIVESSTHQRTPTAFCEVLLPKRRQCVAFSFGINGIWDFDMAMMSKGCRVLSFDPFCCGGSSRKNPDHDFIPVGLSTFDGIADSVDEKHPNITFPVLSLRTIMESYEQPKLDVLRMSVSTLAEWKTLKNLINTGILAEIRQLILNIDFKDADMWKEYWFVINGIRQANFFPFYVAKQPDAEYLKVQEGSQSLYSKYEVSYGNSNAA